MSGLRSKPGKRRRGRWHGTHDTMGREYARVSDTKKGNVLEPDSGFTCMTEGVSRSVHENANGLFVGCSHEGGVHYLDGQLNEAGTHYIGFYSQEKVS